MYVFTWHDIQIKLLTENKQSSPNLVIQVVGVLSHTPKDFRFNTWWGHVQEAVTFVCEDKTYKVKYLNKFVIVHAQNVNRNINKKLVLMADSRKESWVAERAGIK